VDGRNSKINFHGSKEGTADMTESRIDRKKRERRQRRRRKRILARLGAVLLVVAFVAPVGTVAYSAATAPEAAEGTAAGYDAILVSYQGPTSAPGVQRLNPDGSVEWSVSVTAKAGHYDVGPRPDGTIRVTYAKGDQSECGSYEAPCGRTGVAVIDPTTEAVDIRHERPVRSIGDSQIHDAEIIDDDRLLVADMDREAIELIDPASGETVWSWLASSVYPEPEDPTRTDWLHINDVDRIGDGRYLVSVRNANQVLVLDRDDGVVEVINKNADFRVMNKQHNPQWLGQGRLLVADSENDRVVELARQPNGSWVPVWGVGEANNQPFDWPRDADRLPNGHTLITDSKNQRIVVVDTRGETVRTYQVDGVPYEADAVPHGEPLGGPAATGDSTAGASDREGAGPVEGLVTWLQLQFGLPGWIGTGHVYVLGGSLVAGVVGRRLFDRELVMPGPSTD
jgi:outer membrane protein assembly factor BamB